MNAITYSAARESLATIIEKVCNDHDPIIVTKKREQSVVVISLDDFKSLEETAYLLKSPVNARRILESIDELNSGKVVEGKLAE